MQQHSPSSVYLHKVIFNTFYSLIFLTLKVCVAEKSTCQILQPLSFTTRNMNSCLQGVRSLINYSFLSALRITRCNNLCKVAFL